MTTLTQRYESSFFLYCQVLLPVETEYEVNSEEESYSSYLVKEHPTSMSPSNLTGHPVPCVNSFKRVGPYVRDPKR